MELEETTVIDALSLPRWPQRHTPSRERQPERSPAAPEATAPFARSDELNDKLALWNGSIWRLQIDAIVNSTNESLKDTSGLCRKILDAAGKEIWVECEAAEVCRTGEAVVTRGCKLPARKIIHTVGPRYNIKYHNAAENALHMCYRNVLSAAKEESLRSVAFSCIYTKSKGYPRDEAAHIACRTVRRFLEHYSSDFDLVLICVDSLEDQLIYENILPLYFPRSEQEEEKAKTLLNRDLGDEFGEPIIEERKIRISSLGSKTQDNQQDDENELTDDEDTAIQDFCEMSVDPDIERMERLRHQQEERERLARRAKREKDRQAGINYERALEKAQRENFEDLKAMKFIYNAGVDHSGAPVIVYMASELPIPDVDLDRVMLFIIYTLDSIVENKYSVLYVHSGVSEENQPQAKWLKRLFKMLGAKYQDNLKYFYVFEPSLWLKFLLLVGGGFMSREIYRKIVYVASVKELNNIAPPLRLPSYIYGQETKSSSPQTCSYVHEQKRSGVGTKNKETVV